MPSKRRLGIFKVNDANVYIYIYKTDVIELEARVALAMLYKMEPHTMFCDAITAGTDCLECRR